MPSTDYSSPICTWQPNRNAMPQTTRMQNLFCDQVISSVSIQMRAKTVTSKSLLLKSRKLKK